MGSRTFRYVIMLDADPPPVLEWWETLILHFCRLKTIEGPLGPVDYKWFGSRLYIVKRRFTYPEPKRKLKIRFDGSVMPWMN